MGSMKSGEPRYHGEELALVFLFLFFFLGIFIGSFSFRAEARFFPLVMSTPGLILVLLYLIRRFLPETINVIMEGEGEFAIGTRDRKKIGEQMDRIKTQEMQEDSPGPLNMDTDVSPWLKSYLIILFSISYILVSYLVGFYIATIAALAVYFYISKRRTWKHIVENILLCLLLLGIVYIFDSAFGHHFGLGVLTE
jgi:hypothetical protein